MTRDIVVVGGSAGAIGALQTLVAGLPADFPAAVLVVQHIPAHSQSQLAAVLAAAGRLPVKPAEDGEAVQLGHIYVAPPDRHLLIDGGRLRLTKGPRENRSRPAVDVLFRSAAHSCGPRVIGVVLSGALDDGTAGLWAVKDRGGITIVQSPKSAEYTSMPRSALDHVQIDHVCAVDEIAAVLVKVTMEPTTEAVAAETPEGMVIEANIGLEPNALWEGVMRLGPASPNTCPECHGTLVRIREGGIIRFRCHTGHAYSLQTLLAGVNDAIESKLWEALRAIEERILLLKELERIAQTEGDGAKEQHFATQAAATDADAHCIRELVHSREASLSPQET